MWLLQTGATLTKDNMLKRKWQGDPTCRFCMATETVDHLFFQCPTAKVVLGNYCHQLWCTECSQQHESILELDRQISS